jgi:hypothetical protein
VIDKWREELSAVASWNTYRKALWTLQKDWGPSYKTFTDAADELGLKEHVSKSTFNQLAQESNGSTPKWTYVEMFVRLCAHNAKQDAAVEDLLDLWAEAYERLGGTTLRERAAKDSPAAAAASMDTAPKPQADSEAAKPERPRQRGVRRFGPVPALPRTRAGKLLSLGAASVVVVAVAGSVYLWGPGDGGAAERRTLHTQAPVIASSLSTAASPATPSASGSTAHSASSSPASAPASGGASGPIPNLPGPTAPTTSPSESAATTPPAESASARSIPMASHTVTPTATVTPPSTTTYPAKVRWSDDGGSTSIDVYPTPYPGPDHTDPNNEGYLYGQSLTVVCKITDGSKVDVGATYSGPKPPASTTWYHLTTGRWAPAVYVDVGGATIPICS